LKRNPARCADSVAPFGARHYLTGQKSYCPLSAPHLPRGKNIATRPRNRTRGRRGRRIEKISLAQYFKIKNEKQNIFKIICPICPEVEKTFYYSHKINGAEDGAEAGQKASAPIHGLTTLGEILKRRKTQQDTKLSRGKGNTRRLHTGVYLTLPYILPYTIRATAKHKRDPARASVENSLTAILYLCPYSYPHFDLKRDLVGVLTPPPPPHILTVRSIESALPESKKHLIYGSLGNTGRNEEIPLLARIPHRSVDPFTFYPGACDRVQCRH
jgi:hypothetical protein